MPLIFLLATLWPAQAAADATRRLATPSRDALRSSVATLAGRAPRHSPGGLAQGLLEALFARVDLTPHTSVQLSLLDRRGQGLPKLLTRRGGGSLARWVDRARRQGLSSPDGSMRLGEHFDGLSGRSSARTTLVERAGGQRTPIELRQRAVVRYRRATGERPRAETHYLRYDLIAARPAVETFGGKLRVTERDPSLPLGVALLRERRVTERRVDGFIVRWIETRSATVPLSWLATTPLRPAPGRPLLAAR